MGRAFGQRSSVQLQNGYRRRDNNSEHRKGPDRQSSPHPSVWPGGFES